MTNSDEIVKALCRLAAEISEKEKNEAINDKRYSDAAILAVLRVVFKEAERSIE